MAHEFGERLRTQREQRQVTISTIAAQTKIKPSLLEGLESGDLTHWPKGIFGRAYLRDYARAIGLDPEALVAEFLAQHPEFAEVEPSPEELAAAADEQSGLAMRFRRLLGGVNLLPARRPALRPAVATAGTGALHRTYQVETVDPFDEDEALDADDVQEYDGPYVAGQAPYVAQAHDFSGNFEDPAEAVAPPEPDVAPIPIAPRPALASRPANDLSLSNAAELCTRLARALDWRDVTQSLADAAKLLDAVGVIVWLWDARATVLRPSLAHGYAPSVLQRLPHVPSTAENAVAAAFRTGEPCVVDGEGGSTDAVAIPSMGAHGCVGVLALELRPGAPQRETVCAFASILAAQLAMLIPAPEPA